MPESFRSDVLREVSRRNLPSKFNQLLDLLPLDLAILTGQVLLAAPRVIDDLDSHVRLYTGRDWQSTQFTSETAKLVATSFLRNKQYTAGRGLANTIHSYLLGLESGVPFVQKPSQPAGTRRLQVMGTKALQEDWNVLSRSQNWFKGQLKKAFTNAVSFVAYQVGGQPLERVATGFARDGWDEALWQSVIGRPFADKLREDSVGILANAATVAQRHAINMLPQGMTTSEWGERIADFSRNYAARMVLETEQQSTKAVKEMVLRALTDGAGDEEMHRRVEWAWGLNPRYAQAVENFYKGAVDAGKKMGLLRGETSDYKERLLADRAEMLANTESMVAMNFGRQLLWEDAVLRGALPADTQKVWVTAIDERVCPVCEPMDSVTVGLNESFVTKDNTIIVPPAHPRCRCTIVPDSLVKEGIITRTARRYGRNLSEDYDLREQDSAEVLVGKAYGSRSDGVFPGSKSSHPEVGEQSTENGLDEEVANVYADTTPSVSKHYGPGPHPGTGTPQEIHQGFDEAIASLDEGAYDFPTEWLKEHIRGSGLRLGQMNRIKGLANKILDEGFTKPITIWVYDEDGKPFIRDGMHRLEAAHLLGLPRIPAAVHHVEGKHPGNDLRGKFHGWRIRRQGTLPKRDTPFKDVKEEEGFTRWFNERMSRRGEQLAQRPGRKPKEFGAPQKTWQKVKDRIPFLKYDEPPIKWEPVEKHMGPGSHPSGTDQDVHGDKKGGQIVGVDDTTDSWLNEMGFERDKQLSKQEKIALALGGVVAGAVVAYYASKFFDDVTVKRVPGEKFPFGDIDSFDDDRKGPLSREFVRSFQGDSRESSLRNIETAIKNQAREYGFAVADDGVVHAGWAGYRNGVEVEFPRDLPRSTRRSLTFTHNHPSGGTLSVEDIGVALGEKLGAIRAVGPHGNAVEMRFPETLSMIEHGRVMDDAEAAMAEWQQRIGEFWSDHIHEMGGDPAQVDITRHLLVGQTMSDWDNKFHSSVWENFAGNVPSMDFFRYEGVAKHLIGRHNQKKHGRKKGGKPEFDAHERSEHRPMPSNLGGTEPFFVLRNTSRLRQEKGREAFREARAEGKGYWESVEEDVQAQREAVREWFKEKDDGTPENDTGLVNWLRDKGFERDGVISRAELIAISAGIGVGTITAGYALGRFGPDIAKRHNLPFAGPVVGPERKLLRNAYNVEHGGLRSRVGFGFRTISRDGDDVIHASGSVFQGLTPVGGFHRVINVNAKSVDHALFTLDDNVQSTGFGKAFNTTAFEAYREYGLERVTVHANLDVGGYTWASQGFDWRRANDAEYVLARFRITQDELLGDGTTLTMDALGVLPRYVQSRGARFLGDPPISDDAKREIADEIGRIVKSDPTPRDLASLGRNHTWKEGDHEMWAGKKLMLGSSWYGEYDLSKGAPGSISGADAIVDTSRALVPLSDDLPNWEDADEMSGWLDQLGLLPTKERISDDEVLEWLRERPDWRWSD